MAQLNKSNINSIFFEVVERNVYWDKVNGGLFQEDKYEYTPKYKAIDFKYEIFGSFIQFSQFEIAAYVVSNTLANCFIDKPFSIRNSFNLVEKILI